MLDRNADRDKVLAASDIVEVVGEHVQLRAKGREFVGLCPFHDDGKPSMSVVPAKQIFHCFPCGAGGDVFGFVMRYHKLTFPEALKYLADRAGIALTPWQKRGGGSGNGERGSGKQDGPSLRERLSEANRQALGFFAALLKHDEHGREARDYLKLRGVSAEMIDAFCIGVAPDRWDGLATMVKHKDWDVEAFVAAGLIKPRRGSGGEGPGTGDPGSGRSSGDSRDAISDPIPDPRSPNPADCYDLLRHRLIFPIHDQLGRPVAFGGRKLREEEEPKYLNSPESELFKKAGTLYGLHLAKKRIIDTKTAVMVEGYTDVIACHQAGATNVVAALGTALTPEHAKVLKRFCEKVVLVMDGDEAGQKAADRAIEVFLTADLDVCLATIPGGADPDELLKQDGGLKRWDALVTDAKDALEWQFNRLAEQLDAADTVTGRQRLAEAFAQRIVDAGLARVGSLRRALVAQRLAALLGLEPSGVEALLKSFKPRPTRATPPPVPKPASPAAPSPKIADLRGAGAVPADVYDHLHDNAHDLDFDPGVPNDAPPGIFSDTRAASAPAAGPETINPVNQIDSAVASPISRGKLKGLHVAEQRVLAALLTDPALFDVPVPNKRSVSEEIAPAEFITEIHRGVYQRLFDALCDGRRPTLAGMLSELSDPAHHADPAAARSACEALTAADAELSALLESHLDEHGQPNPDVLRQTLLDAAAVLLDFQEHRRLQQSKRDLIAPADPADSVTKAAAAQALIDRFKTAGSPTRIGKANPR